MILDGEKIYLASKRNKRTLIQKLLPLSRFFHVSVIDYSETGRCVIVYDQGARISGELKFFSHIGVKVIKSFQYREQANGAVLICMDFYWPNYLVNLQHIENQLSIFK